MRAFEGILDISVTESTICSGKRSALAYIPSSEVRKKKLGEERLPFHTGKFRKPKPYIEREGYEKGNLFVK